MFKNDVEDARAGQRKHNVTRGEAKEFKMIFVKVEMKGMEGSDPG